MMQWQKNQYSYSNPFTTRFITLPRMFWVNKNWSLKQLHHEIFKFLIKIFYKWYELAENPVNARDIPQPKYKSHSIDEQDDKELSF